MNTNGLISSRDVSATGKVESNFFVRKGDPLPAPQAVGSLTILSPDKAEQTSISVDNNGTTKLLSEGYIDLESENGNVYVACASTNEDPLGLYIAPTTQSGVGILRIYNGDESVHYDFSVATNNGAGRSQNDLEIFGASQAGVKRIMNANVLGTAIVLGGPDGPDGTILQIDGPEGLSRVYDVVYNPPPPPPAPLPMQMVVDPAPIVDLLYGTGSGTSVKGSFKRFTLNAVPPFSEEKEIPTIYLGGSSVNPQNPVVANVGDTYGIQFTTVAEGSQVGIVNPNAQLPTFRLEPTPGDVYWFVCNVQNQFIPVGVMKAMSFVPAP